MAEEVKALLIIIVLLGSFLAMAFYGGEYE